MPRTARIDAPNLLHHVIARGIERRDIFLDDDDRRNFLERLSTLFAETSTRCFAWALMKNHFHLLLMPEAQPLATFMRRLLTGHALFFNRRHARSGHLFQNRYKSIVCEEEPYLLELIRYIHLNPLRAGAVLDLTGLDGYPWSGHAVLMGMKQLAGYDAEGVLHLFAGSRNQARKRYRSFMEDGVPQGRRNELVGGGLRRSQGMAGGEDIAIEPFDERILGSGPFVEEILSKILPADHLVTKRPLPDLAEKIAGWFDIPSTDILRPGKARKPAAARSVLCYLAVREMGYPGREVGTFLHLGSSGVSLAAKRGEKYVRENPGIVSSLSTIEK